MINVGKILNRAWQILWNYRILWIFGLLLAITAGTGGSSGSSYRANGNNTDGTHFQENSPQFMQEMNRWFEASIEPLFATEEKTIQTIIWIGVGLAIFILVIAAIMALVRYPSETAVIRMVDEYERTGTKVGFRQGWKLGWSRAAFRLWVIDLVVSLPAILLIGLLIGLGFAIYFSIESGSQFTAVTGIVASIGCLFLFLFLFILGMVFLNLLRQFFWRAAALEDQGVRASFAIGWETFKRNWQSAALMWLVMFGLGIGYALASIILLFLLLPLLVITIIMGTLVAAVPGLLFGWLISLFSPVWVAMLVGALIFLPIFFLVAFSPSVLITGWVKIYASSIWTLTYREMKALESMKMEKALPVKTA